MAGLGRKVFTRERATVADVNGYLMDQSVMVFASASARTAAIPSSQASEGMVSYLRDVNRFDFYDGSAWQRMDTDPPRIYQQATFFATTIADGTEPGVAQLSIPDPGWPYVIDVSGLVAVAAQAGVLTAARVRLDTIGGTIVSMDIPRSGALPAGETIPLPIPEQTSAVLTGGHTLIMAVRRVAGTGNWATSASNQLLRGVVRRAG